MNYLGLKDSSRDFSENCAISFFSTFSTSYMCPNIRCNAWRQKKI
jgi:hypothetical protein